MVSKRGSKRGRHGVRKVKREEEDSVFKQAEKKQKRWKKKNSERGKERMKEGFEVKEERREKRQRMVSKKDRMEEENEKWTRRKCETSIHTNNGKDRD